MTHIFCIPKRTNTKTSATRKKTSVLAAHAALAASAAGPTPSCTQCARKGMSNKTPLYATMRSQRSSSALTAPCARLRTSTRVEDHVVNLLDVALSPSRVLHHERNHSDVVLFLVQAGGLNVQIHYQHVPRQGAPPPPAPCVNLLFLLF